ncbi:hypothetical protein QAD02_020064 [Eretmocerus hayati]|uniref:Uncharacterized protein n=1 Tax=Eretmocerus hayati TaxID=131215 RepID=A0ACC2PLF0_9HYME|nr:hypothetical protein QAD02_020064 [Eretmocerus hayati]
MGICTYNELDLSEPHSSTDCHSFTMSCRFLVLPMESAACNVVLSRALNIVLNAIDGIYCTLALGPCSLRLGVIVPVEVPHRPDWYYQLRRMPQELSAKTESKGIFYKRL